MNARSSFSAKIMRMFRGQKTPFCCSLQAPTTMQQRKPCSAGDLNTYSNSADLKSALGSIIWVHNNELTSPAAKKLAEEGSSLMIEAYETQLKLYGEADITTAETASRLGTYYNDIKDCARAEPLRRKVYEAYRKMFRAEAPETLSMETKLAATLTKAVSRKGSLGDS